MTSVSPVALPTGGLGLSFRHSFFSACFGVSASVSAKYGLTDEWTNYFVEQTQQAWQQQIWIPKEIIQNNVDAWITTSLEQRIRILFWFYRIIFILLQLLLNSFMLHYFVRSMHASNSLMATTFNQCFSIILAGVSGYLCFAELIPTTWLIGVLLIMIGVYCVQSGSTNSANDDSVENPTSTSAKLSSHSNESTIPVSHLNQPQPATTDESDRPIRRRR